MNVGDSRSKLALNECFAEVGKAMSSPRRLELLDLLTQGERTVEALAKAAGLGLTTASAHLQSLRRAGLVSTRRDGTRVHYTVAGPDVAALLVMLRSVAQDRVAGTEPARRAYLGLAELDETRAIGARQLLAEPDTYLVLDVRPSHEFGQGHVPGAVSIPVDELADRLGELPADRTVVAYCRGRYCAFSHEAARLLRRHGIDAMQLVDGMLEWRLAGHPIVLPVAA